MEINEEKTIDMLTINSVSVLTQKFIEINGVKTQVGENHRCTYVNSKIGRQYLREQESQNVVDSVFAIWGDTPTVIVEEIVDENVIDNE